MISKAKYNLTANKIDGNYIIVLLREYNNSSISFPQSVKLVYASSSSVYGKTSAVPFRLSEATDRPSNMYAATKKADELLAAFYCRSEQLSAVGLRFFTVYGPWGRPDMAVYKFAEAILNNKELPLFQKSWVGVDFKMFLLASLSRPWNILHKKWSCQ